MMDLALGDVVRVKNKNVDRTAIVTLISARKIRVRWYENGCPFRDAFPLDALEKVTP